MAEESDLEAATLCPGGCHRQHCGDLGGPVWCFFSVNMTVWSMSPNRLSPRKK